MKIVVCDVCGNECEGKFAEREEWEMPHTVITPHNEVKTRFEIRHISDADICKACLKMSAVIALRQFTSVINE